MGNKSFIIVGLLGCVTGIIVATIGEADDTPVPSAASPIPDASLDIPEESPQTSATQVSKDGSNDILDAVRDAHNRLSDGEQGANSRLSTAFVKAIRSEKTYKPILTDFFKRVGQGALMSGGKLTDAGAAILDYASKVAS